MLVVCVGGGVIEVCFMSIMFVNMYGLVDGVLFFCCIMCCIILLVILVIGSCIVVSVGYEIVDRK